MCVLQVWFELYLLNDLCLRTSHVRKSKTSRVFQVFWPPTLSGSVVDLDLWINIEGGIGIVCTCLPILRSLFRVLLPSSFLSYFSRNSRSDGPHELKDQFNIRGRLRRIPSATAKEDELSNPETGLGSNWRPEQWSSSKTLNDSKPDIGISVEGITRVPAKGSSNVI